MAKAKTPKTDAKPAEPEQQATPTVPPGTVAPAVVNKTTVIQVPQPAAKADDTDPWDLHGPVDDEPETPAGDQPAAATAPSAAPVADAPPPAPEQPKVHTHSKRLVREALDWGFTQAEIDRTPTDQLDDLVYERQRTYRLAQQQQQQAQQKPEVKAEPEPDIALPPEAAEYDENTRKVLKAVVAQPLKEVAELKKQLAEMQERDKQREVRENQRVFAGLLDKHKTVFTDDAAGNAKKLAIIAYLQNVQQPAGLENDFEAGVKLLFGATPSPAPPAPAPKAEPEPDPLAETKKAFAEGGLARPTERKEPDLPPGDARALRFLKDRLGERKAQAVNGDVKQTFMDEFFG